MSEIERHSLDAHVSICELRYQALNDRLDRIDQDMTELKSLIQGLHRDLDRQQDQTMNHCTMPMIHGLIVNRIRP